MILYNLDETDRIILDILQEDGRATYAEIARHTHLSRVAVRDRVKSLADRGVIKRFTVQLNAASVGYYTMAFLQVSLAPGAHCAIERLTAIPYVTQVLSTTGSNVLHVQGYFRDLVHLNEFIREVVSPIPGIQSVETRLVLENHKMNHYMVLTAP